MRGMTIGGAGLLALFLATAVQAASNIECMDSGYSAEQEASFAQFYEGFTPKSMDEGGPPLTLVEPLSSRAGDCAEANGWSSDAIYNAVIYRMSSMLARALELKTPFTPEQMDRLNAALANADQARLRQILGPSIEASLDGKDGPEMSKEDEIYLGAVVIGAGLPLDQSNSEFAGSLLGARMMADIAVERFKDS